MPTLFCDAETYSTLNLKEVGAWRYANHPTTGVWCVCYAVDAGPVEIWLPGQPIPEVFFEAARNPDWIVIAHHAAFEAAIILFILAPRFGWPVVPTERLRCTMAMARASALPGKLEKVAEVLRLSLRKDVEGARLMRQMSRPRKPRRDEDSAGNYWHDEPDKRERLAAYCKRDVEVERELYHCLPLLTEAEQALWVLDSIINARGFYTDGPLLEAASRVAAAADRAVQTELAEITNGALTSTDQVATMLAWLAGHDCEVKNITKPTLRHALRRKNLDPVIRRVIELRLEAAHAAAGKIDALRAYRNPDGRVRGTLQFHGAATGRWAGTGPQPQNFKRDSDDIDGKCTAIASGDLKLVANLYSPLEAVGDIARATICGAPGHRLLIGDFSGIESRVTAWISGQVSKLDDWAKFDASGDSKLEPYYLIGRALGLPEELARDKGKVADLGFMGGAGAWDRLAPDEDASSEDDKRRYQKTWRNLHPNTVAFWRNINHNAVIAVRQPGRAFNLGRLRLVSDRDFLRITMPSGRALSYPFPRLGTDKYDNPTVIFMDNAGGKFVDCHFGQGAYGGLWTENIVQAISRDLLAAAMQRLEAAGYPVVLHVHDEVVCEVPIGVGSLDEFKQLLTAVPDWATGLPIAAKVREGERFSKPSKPKSAEQSKTRSMLLNGGGGSNTLDPDEAAADEANAIWANRDHDVPVHLMNEPVQTDPAGRWYQKVEYAGQQNFVPADELRPVANAVDHGAIDDEASDAVDDDATDEADEDAKSGNGAESPISSNISRGGNGAGLGQLSWVEIEAAFARQSGNSQPQANGGNNGGGNGNDADGGRGYPHGERRGGQQIALYLYYDHLGRNHTKIERQRPANGGRAQYPQSFWVQGQWVQKKPPGWLKIPYRLPELLAAPPGTDVLIPEGEKDVESLLRLGLTATTNSEGATPLKAKVSKWTPELNRWFTGIKRIFILEDNDEPGRQFAREKAKALAGIVPDIRIVSFPDVPDGEDVTWWLEHGHGKDELLARCEAAPKWQLTTLQSVRASQVTMRAVQWLWPDRFALGKLGIFAGLPDEGKSMLTHYIAARITRPKQNKWPNSEGEAPQGNVILLTAEDDPEDTVIPRLVAAEADLDRVEIVSMVRDQDRDGRECERMFSLADDLALLRQKIDEVGDVRAILIDPVTAYLGKAGSIDSYRDSDVRAVLTPWVYLARELRIAIIAVMHFNKKVDVTNALLRISNSLAFGGVARHVFSVTDDEENGRKLMARAKNNIAAKTDNQTLAFHFDTREVGSDPDIGEVIRAPLVVFEPGYVDVSATEALSAMNENKAPAERDRAKRFVLDLLAGGQEILATEIKAAAEANGLSWRTINRAKDELEEKDGLNIVVDKDRSKQDGKWFWKLET